MCNSQLEIVIFYLEPLSILMQRNVHSKFLLRRGGKKLKCRKVNTLVKKAFWEEKQLARALFLPEAKYSVWFFSRMQEQFWQNT